MSKSFFKGSLLLLLTFCMLTIGLTGAAAPTSSDSLCCISGFDNTTAVSSLGVFAGASPLRASSSSYEGVVLYPGGIPFGVKFMTEGVLITSLTDINTQNGKVCPAKNAGLKPNDIIIKVNGKTLSDAAELSELTESSAGSPIVLVCVRDSQEFSVSLSPALCTEEGKYKTGMFVRDSGAGIGTVTYIVPDSLSFGGLGHGICDGDTGKLIPMQRGSVVGVTINGVKKGLSGSPGEVQGYFSSGKTGTLFKNTECGVFGTFAQLPQNLVSKPIPIGTRNTLKVGKAYILTTLDGTTPTQYEIEISDIRVNSTTNKCFTVEVTDKALLEKSGGIVQGMFLCYNKDNTGNPSKIKVFQCFPIFIDHKNRYVLQPNTTILNERRKHIEYTKRLNFYKTTATLLHHAPGAKSGCCFLYNAQCVIVKNIFKIP